MSEIREEYFTKKYLHYTYENDLRGLIPNWVSEVEEVFSELLVDLESSVVLDVGIGNGIEAPCLFPTAKELIGADISGEMLKEAIKKFSRLRVFKNAAEDLRDIASGSIDVYVSLRTRASFLLNCLA